VKRSVFAMAENRLLRLTLFATMAQNSPLVGLITKTNSLLQNWLIFESIKYLGVPNVNMKYRFMKMMNFYKEAIEEGSNMLRTNTAIFGAREYR